MQTFSKSASKLKTVCLNSIILERLNCESKLPTKLAGEGFGFKIVCFVLICIDESSYADQPQTKVLVPNGFVFSHIRKIYISISK